MREILAHGAREDGVQPFDVAGHRLDQDQGRGEVQRDRAVHVRAAEAITPAWTSDNTSVATVDAAGTATGVAAGQATLTASYQGKTATRGLRVIPDYAGRWAGNWGVTSCSVQGDFVANWCDPVRNGSFPATLDILQAKDVVSATWTLQEATGAAQGNIAGDGRPL